MKSTHHRNIGAAADACGRTGAPWIAALASLVLLGALAWVPASAELVTDGVERGVSARHVFGQLAAAWEAGDERALADLVHSDGLRVTPAGGGDRGGRYSPSQAHYFFKNLFRAHRTLSFEFLMTQDGAGADRARGLAEWKRRKADSETIQTIKVVCVLAREGDLWRLAELNTIR